MSILNRQIGPKSGPHTCGALHGTLGFSWHQFILLSNGGAAGWEIGKWMAHSRCLLKVSIPALSQQLPHLGAEETEALRQAWGNQGPNLGLWLQPPHWPSPEETQQGGQNGPAGRERLFKKTNCPTKESRALPPLGRTLSLQKGPPNPLGLYRRGQQGCTKSPGPVGQTPLPLSLHVIICAEGITNS